MIIQEIFRDAIMFSFPISDILNARVLYLVKGSVRQTHDNRRMGCNNKLGMLLTYRFHYKGN